MNGEALAREYLRKAKNRLRAVRILQEGGSYDDVIRECQEIVELVLKGILRKVGLDPPRTHDVGAVLTDHAHRLPPAWRADLAEIVSLSKELSEERAQSFYGDEEGAGTFLDRYGKESADRVLERTERLVVLYEEAVGG